MKADAYVTERRLAIKKMQEAAGVAPFDWPEAFRIARGIFLWLCVCGAAIFGIAWALGSGLDWLEGVAKAWAK
jgi:hypothetical protein